MLGEEGTEQFVVTTEVDGKVIREQKIHDPFITITTVVILGRWQAFLGIFRRRTCKIRVHVSGTRAVQSRIMMLDPLELQREQEVFDTHGNEVTMSCGEVQGSVGAR